jgi:hypothetical protein
MKLRSIRNRSSLDELTITELRRGDVYRAATQRRIEVGEYLGIETTWGDRAILLKTGSGTSSVLLSRILSLTSVAA